MPAETPFADTLDAWFSRLDEASFRVGVRERLLVQSLLAQLAAAGDLPRTTTAEQLLLRVRPLLCTRLEQQRQYGALLGQFLLERGTRPVDPSVLRTSRSMGDVTRPRVPRWALAAGAALILVLAGDGVRRLRSSAITQPVQRTQTQTGGSLSRPGTPAIVHPIYVPVIGWSNVSMTTAAPAWSAWLRTGLVTIGALSALGVCWLAYARWRRKLYLRGARTDKEIEERLLTDPDPVPVDMPAPLARRVASTLRRRYASERLTLDIHATLRATMAACGGLSPRYAVVPQTPEHLALIDRRHPSDHHAAYSTALITALARNGVTVQVYYFEGSPQTGCWRMRPGQSHQDRFDVVSFGELAARQTGHRLLVFSEAQAIVDGASGELQPWASYLNAFPQRAWLTPMPLGSWGREEQAADAQGFLVLPVQPEALHTLADWLSADQLALTVGADWPLTFPPLLQPSDVAWVARREPPPAETVRELTFQLRAYLGALRFQWLCACAICPAVAPAVTLALGRELTDDPRELALGLSALGALPWFRHAAMPAWLRLALLDHLEPGNEARFRAVLEQRLNAAIEGVGPALLSVAAQSRRLTAWMRRGLGPARDVILVDFVQRGRLARLAQRLPDGLRRRLFRRGSPAYGVRTGLVALLPLGLLVSAIALPGIWDRIVEAQEMPSLRLVRQLPTGQAEVTSLSISPDGRLLVTGVSSGGLRLWNLQTGMATSEQQAVHNGPVQATAFGQDAGVLFSAGADGKMELFSVLGGSRLGPGDVERRRTDPAGERIIALSEDTGIAIATAGGVQLWEGSDVWEGRPGVTPNGVTSRVVALAFSPDGQRLAAGGSDGAISLWGAHSLQDAPLRIGAAGSGGTASSSARRFGQEPVPDTAAAAAASALAFSPDGRQLLSAHSDGMLWLWDVATGKAVGSAWNGGPAPILGLAFSPDGRQIANTSGGVVRLWDAATRQSLGATAATSTDRVLRIAFTPEGRTLVAGGSDGVRLWGSDVRAALDLVGCRTIDVDQATVSLADTLAAGIREGTLPALSVAAYSRDAWGPPGRQLPPFGTVAYASPVLESAAPQELEIARTVAQRVGTALSQSPRQLRSSGDIVAWSDLAAGRLLINTCPNDEATPAPAAEYVPPTGPAVSRQQEAPVAEARRQIALAEDMINAGRLPEAADAFARAAAIDPTVNVTARIVAVRQRIVNEGEKAYLDGMNLAKYERNAEAVPLLQKACRYLPDTHRDMPAVRQELARLGYQCGAPAAAK